MFTLYNAAVFWEPPEASRKVAERARSKLAQLTRLIANQKRAPVIKPTMRVNGAY